MNDVTATLHATTYDGQIGDLKPLLIASAACLLLATLWPASAQAAGSRAAVEARPGEMVLLRAVPARHATRSMPPGQALLVNPSPESELESGLSHLEIANENYGRVAAGSHGTPGGAIAGSMSSFMSPLGVSGGQSGPAPKAATGGAMGAATGSISSHVTGALAGAGLMGQGGSR